MSSMPTSPSPLPARQGINPHAAQPTSTAALVRSLWRNRQLIYQMSRREVVGRYKGSIMGLGWSFFTPLLMLAVCTWIQKAGKGFADAH
jgi:lipopolysaccharide transport system permease protein